MTLAALSCLPLVVSFIRPHVHTAGTGWAFSLQVQGGQSGRRPHHGGSSCCLSGVSQPPRQMRCPWRPSCLSDCGNSGLPKARGWERKQYGPCQSSSLTSSLCCPHLGGGSRDHPGTTATKGARVRRENSRALGCLGGFTSWHTPDPRRGGWTLPAKSPTTMSLCCQHGSQKSINLVETPPLLAPQHVYLCVP